MSVSKNPRVNFARVKNPYPYPDFLEVQLQSFRDFLQLDTPTEKRKNEGLYKVFSENFPIADTRNNFVLEFLDADMSGHADELRKMACERGDDVKVLYYAKINAAMIGAAGTDNEEENRRHEEFITSFEKVTRKRLWLDFLKRLW